MYKSGVHWYVTVTVAVFGVIVSTHVSWAGFESDPPRYRGDGVIANVRARGKKEGVWGSAW